MHHHYYHRQNQEQNPAPPVLSRFFAVTDGKPAEKDFGPSQVEIARRAYLRFVNAGSQPGSHVQHWLAAEAELTRNATARAGTASPTAVNLIFHTVKDPVYKFIELTGTSAESIEDAVDRAVKRAHKTIKNLCWFQVVETRGNISKGKVQHWQVTIKVSFAVED